MREIFSYGANKLDNNYDWTDCNLTESCSVF